MSGTGKSPPTLATRQLLLRDCAMHRIRKKTIDRSMRLSKKSSPDAASPMSVLAEKLGELNTENSSVIRITTRRRLALTTSSLNSPSSNEKDSTSSTKENISPLTNHKTLKLHEASISYLSPQHNSQLGMSPPLTPLPTLSPSPVNSSANRNKESQCDSSRHSCVSSVACSKKSQLCIRKYLLHSSAARNLSNLSSARPGVTEALEMISGCTVAQDSLPGILNNRTEASMVEGFEAKEVGDCAGVDMSNDLFRTLNHEDGVTDNNKMASADNLNEINKTDSTIVATLSSPLSSGTVSGEKTSDSVAESGVCGTVCMSCRHGQIVRRIKRRRLNKSAGSLDLHSSDIQSFFKMGSNADKDDLQADVAAEVTADEFISVKSLNGDARRIVACQTDASNSDSDESVTTANNVNNNADGDDAQSSDSNDNDYDMKGNSDTTTNSYTTVGATMTSDSNNAATGSFSFSASTPAHSDRSLSSLGSNMAWSGNYKASQKENYKASSTAATSQSCSGSLMSSSLVEASSVSSFGSFHFTSLKSDKRAEGGESRLESRSIAGPHRLVKYRKNWGSSGSAGLPTCSKLGLKQLMCSPIYEEKGSANSSPESLKVKCGGVGVEWKGSEGEDKENRSSVARYSCHDLSFERMDNSVSSLEHCTDNIAQDSNIENNRNYMGGTTLESGGLLCAKKKESKAQNKIFPTPGVQSLKQDSPSQDSPQFISAPMCLSFSPDVEVGKSRINAINLSTPPSGLLSAGDPHSITPTGPSAAGSAATASTGDLSQVARNIAYYTCRSGMRTKSTKYTRSRLGDKMVDKGMGGSGMSRLPEALVKDDSPMFSYTGTSGNQVENNCRAEFNEAECLHASFNASCVADFSMDSSARRMSLCEEMSGKFNVGNSSSKKRCRSGAEDCCMMGEYEDYLNTSDGLMVDISGTYNLNCSCNCDLNVSKVIGDECSMDLTDNVTENSLEFMTSGSRRGNSNVCSDFDNNAGLQDDINIDSESKRASTSFGRVSLSRQPNVTSRPVKQLFGSASQSNLSKIRPSLMRAQSDSSGGGARKTFSESESAHKSTAILRTQSEIVIKRALRSDDDTSDLIGDRSKPYALPVVKDGKRVELASISADTLADLLNGCYNDVVKKFIVVDCRYPYEFDGGHVKGAVNIFTREDIAELLKPAVVSSNPASQQLDEQLTDNYSSQQHDEQVTAELAPPVTREKAESGTGTMMGAVLIFHCEFSSERGPKMMKFLRQCDRDVHMDSYPTLLYPELYLLEGGYKSFHSSYPSLCVPPGGYRPMIHTDHAEDLRQFRIKSKSWSACPGLRNHKS